MISYNFHNFQHPQSVFFGDADVWSRLLSRKARSSPWIHRWCCGRISFRNRSFRWAHPRSYRMGRPGMDRPQDPSPPSWQTRSGSDGWPPRWDMSYCNWSLKMWIPFGTQTWQEEIHYKCCFGKNHRTMGFSKPCLIAGGFQCSNLSHHIFVVKNNGASRVLSGMFMSLHSASPDS